jgi:hypothetical protein
MPSDPESTGEEATYLKSLVDLATPVVVVLKSGEQLHGQLRYYDRDVFSLGPSDGGPKLLLRKTSIRYLYEEEAGYPVSRFFLPGRIEQPLPSTSPAMRT